MFLISYFTGPFVAEHPGVLSWLALWKNYSDFYIFSPHEANILTTKKYDPSIDSEFKNTSIELSAVSF